MLREELLDLVAQQSDDTLEALVSLIPAIAEMRKGGLLAVETFGKFHDVGLPVSLVIQTQPGRRERERVEASVVTGRTTQLVLDFDIERAS